VRTDLLTVLSDLYLKSEHAGLLPKFELVTQIFFQNSTLLLTLKSGE
jgi:hypothetical protein